MMSPVQLEQIQVELNELIATPNAYRSLLILISLVIIAYILSRFLAQAIVKIAQVVATKSDNISDTEKAIRYRQIETYLSIFIALVRAIVVAVAAYIGWRVMAPQTSSSGAAAIGASAFFIVFAGQTLGMVLRDLTAGAVMIIEGWFHVGDYVKIEPFLDLAGVVERFNLRSTKLRSLSGEVIWVHNQQIQAVHVTKNGTRIYIVDIFTGSPEMAKEAIQKVIDVVPASSALVRNPLKFHKAEKWNDDLWHLTVQAKVAPGREWLIESFFINALKDLDKGRRKSERLFVYEPTARFADPRAEKEFRRAIRSK